MTKDDAAELLDLIIERAPDLRAAGVLTVELGEAGFSLAPAERADVDMGDKEEGETPTDVLRDPWTHGRPGKDSPTTLTVNRRKV